MDSRLKLRLEAARLAAQLGPTSAADLVKESKTIEKYILGKAQLPEYVSTENIVDMTVSKGLEAIKAKEDMENNKRWQQMEKEYNDAVENLRKSKTHSEPKSGALSPLFGTDKQMQLQDNVDLNPFLPDTVLAVDRQHDPTFRSRLMKVFAEYPSTGKDLAQVTRERQELYHDMGLAPEPFNERHSHPPCDTTRETAYLAPGGIPCSEAESIFLQENGEKVE